MKGAETRGPGFGAPSDLIMPRATWAELIAMSCVLCLPVKPCSDRQYGCNCREKIIEEDRGQSMNRAKTHGHTGTWNIAWCLVLYVLKKAQQQPEVVNFLFGHVTCHMSPSSPGHGGRYDTKYSLFDYCERHSWGREFRKHDDTSFSTSTDKKINKGWKCKSKTGDHARPKVRNN